MGQIILIVLLLILIFDTIRGFKRGFLKSLLNHFFGGVLGFVKGIIVISFLLFAIYLCQYIGFKQEYNEIMQTSSLLQFMAENNPVITMLKGAMPF